MYRTMKELIPLVLLDSETTTVVMVISSSSILNSSWTNSIALKPPYRTSLILEEDIVTDTYRTIRRTILLVFMSIFVLLTTSLNLLALIVLYRPVFHQNIYAFGQKFLAFQNIFFALVLGTTFFVMGVSGGDIDDWHQDYCIAFRTLYLILSACTNWTVVFLTAIRYMSIRHPMMFHNTLFYKGAYISLLSMALFASLFYALLYTNMHWFFHVVEKGYDRKSTEQCYLFLRYDLGTVLFLWLLQLPDTVLPLICVIYLNIRIIGASNDVGSKKDLLKQELHNMSSRLNSLRRSLADTNPSCQPIPAEAETVDLMPDNNPSDVCSVDQPSQLTAAAVEAPETPAPTTIVSSLRESSISKPITRNSNITPLLAFDDKEYRIKKEMERQRRNLRRATLAYELLCETSGALGSAESSPRKSTLRPRKKSEWVTDYAPSEARRCMCLCCLYWSLSVKRLLTLSTVVFVVLNLPFCLWFVFSNHLAVRTSKDLALSRLLSIVFTSLKFFSHLTYTLIYIYGGIKFRSENYKFMRSYACRTRRQKSFV